MLQEALVYVLLRTGVRLGSWGKMGQDYQNQGRELRKSVEMGRGKATGDPILGVFSYGETVSSDSHGISRKFYAISML